MKYFPPSNHIYYEGTDIPVNKFDIRDSELIHEIESELLFHTYEHFHTALDETTLFDAYYFKEIHHFLFTKLYSWAGEYRTVNISKGESLFCPAKNIKSYSQTIFSQLKNENYLKGFEDPTLKKIFSERLAYYTCELIALHPFNEGNGRTLRLLMDMIATYNGYEYIDYSKTLESKSYITASIECMNADSTMMSEIIFDGLVKEI